MSQRPANHNHPQPVSEESIVDSRVEWIDAIVRRSLRDGISLRQQLLENEKQSAAIAAVAGKLAAGFAAGRDSSPWVVGWGMVPRGEVGLIFAMVGKNLGVMSEAMFSVIVIMVILTTLLTPPILTVLLRLSLIHI